MSNWRKTAKPVPERHNAIRKVGLLAAFRRSTGGTAAVEFAMVALPFMMLLFGILEIGMIFFASTTLENATTQAARQIRTGQWQTSSTPSAANFKQAICDQMSWLQSSCTSDLYIDVRTSDSFTDVTPPSVVTGGVIDQSKLSFTPGAPDQITVVRAFYRWPLFAPGMTGALANLSGGAALLSSVAAFRTEPYTGGT